MINRRPTRPRLQATAVDTVIVAIAPALIIGMVACLIFFLVVAFYRGEYDVRLMYILGLYTLATVLIARIAIESGRAYANLFSIPLAVVSLLAMLRFVVIAGPLGPFNWVVNIVLLGLAWYLADRITFDCTVVDERKTAPQQGLLQTLGLLKREHASATSAPNPTGLATEARPRKKRNPKHNPGVWVLYFALLAFPLFGLGQLVIPEGPQRRSAFYFLVGYLACALCLLVTTSFVGMRRYLRQKGVSMPSDMVGRWLGVGAIGVVLILLACMILPLPGRSLGLIGLPFEFTAPDNLSTSRFGWGSEGPQESQQQDAATTQSDRGPQDGPPSADTQGNPAADGRSTANDSSATSAKDGKSESQSSDKQSSGQSNQQPAGDQPSNTASENAAESNQAERTGQGSDSSASTNPDGSEENSGNSNPSDQPKTDSANGPASQSDAPPPDASTSTERDSDSAADARDAESTSTASPTSKPQFGGALSQWMSALPSSLAEIFKWLTMAILLVIVVLYILTHPGEIAKLWRDFCHLLAQLFGSKRKPAATEEKPAPAASRATVIRKPFRAFENPFASQLTGWPPARVIEHTFSAFEAWAADHGFPRQGDQTATEFARKVARQASGVGPQAISAAHMLDQLMFAGWQPQAQDIHPLAQFWKTLENSPATK